MILLALCFTLLSVRLHVAAKEAYGYDGHNRRHYDGYTGANLSARHILDKGIGALGGHSNLNALKGVTSHA